MTIEQFNKSEGIVSEIRRIEEFLDVYKKHHNISICAYKPASTSLDVDREKHFLIYNSDSETIASIEKALEERKKKLEKMLSEV